jgi:putative transposase
VQAKFSTGRVRKIYKFVDAHRAEYSIKLLWLALRNVLRKSVRSTFDWKRAMNQFAILYGERFTLGRT